MLAYTPADIESPASLYRDGRKRTITICTLPLRVFASLTMGTQVKSSRRWLRYSLRTALVLVALVSIALSWLVHKAREQAVHVAALQQMGCTVTYDASPPYNTADTPTALRWLRQILGEPPESVASVEGAGSKITDAGMLHIGRLTYTYKVFLDLTQVTDAGVAHLRALPDLIDVNLRRTHVTDKGLRNLSGLKFLMTLDLSETKITDAGLAYLNASTRLEVLTLSDTAVTDAGISHLLNFSELKNLYLDGTQVTDEGLKQLAKLKQLTQVDLTRTKVTQAGMQQLQRALPKCTIDFRSPGAL